MKNFAKFISLKNKQRKIITLFFGAALCTLNIQVAFALSNDRNQPADITADDVEIDFNTGKRVFTGNVRIIQGSLKIKADKLVANYSDGRLQDATAYGNPAKFRQRADGKSVDDEGEGREIYVNAPENSIDLKKRAKLKQGGQVANGNHIYYNRASGKLKIKGLGQNKTKPSPTQTDPFFNDSSTSAPTQTPGRVAPPTSTNVSPSTSQNTEDLPLYNPNGSTSINNYTSTAPVATPQLSSQPSPQQEYTPPVIDRGETLPEKLVLPKKTSSSSSNRSRLIILPK